MTKKTIMHRGLLVVMVALSMCWPTRPLQATTAEAASAIDWATSSGVAAPPADSNGTPGFVGFTDVLTTDNLKATANNNYPNSAKLLKNSSGTDVGVQLLNGEKQASAIWSTYAFSLRKKFTAKMRLYLGSASDQGDGMAVVLAGKRPTITYLPGPYLGIWRDRAGTATTVKYPDSFALVFDMKMNTDRSAYVDGTYFDTGIYSPNGKSVEQYFAWGFPNQTAQYRQFSKTIDSPKLFFDTNNTADGGLNETDNKGTYGATKGLGGYEAFTSKVMNNGAWHNLDITWTPDSIGGGTIAFSFEVDGRTIAKQLTWTASQVQQVFQSDEVYFGFTGSTTNFKGTNLIAFRELPGLVEATMDVEIKKPDGTATGTTVDAGTNLTQEYTLIYDPSASAQAWPNPGADGQQPPLTATFKAATNYGFVVQNGQVAITMIEDDGTKRVVQGTPGTDRLAVVNAQGDTLETTGSVTLTDIPGFPDEDDGGLQLAKQFAVPIAATTVGAGTTATFAGLVTGNNALVTANVDAPAVKALPFHLISVPDFEFGDILVGDIINGLKNRAATNDTAIKVYMNNQDNYRLTAALSSLDLGPNYAPGMATLQFQYNGKTISLTDDGAMSADLFNQATPVAPAVTDARLSIAPFPQVVAKQIKAEITWTAENVPEIK